MRGRLSAATPLRVFFLVMLLRGEVPVMAQHSEVSLPPVRIKGAVSVEEAIYQRRSRRQFEARPLSFEEIGQLLWAAQGITAVSGDLNFRAAPSAGATYPMDVYAVTGQAVYLYVPEGHKLVTIEEKNLTGKLAEASWGQEAVAQAPLSIVICGTYRRTTDRYGDRGRQYVFYEAGHIAQNIHLQAVALGLGSVPVGAFDEQAVAALLPLNPGQRPLYIVPVGYVRE